MNPLIFGVIALAVILLSICSVFIGVAVNRWREARREEDKAFAEQAARLAAHTNLDEAVEIQQRLQLCRAVMEELKRAFKNDELDGGWKAALKHPLYLEAEAEIAKLQDELKVLI